MFKRLLRSAFMTAFIGWLIAAYMVLIKYSTRWEVQNFDRAQPVINGQKGLIALTWHSRFMMLNSAWKKQYALPYVLISRSRDGAIVAKTTQFLGLKTIRGSAQKIGSDKAKGGAQAGSAIIDAIRNDGCVVITPDGPRGPRQRLGEGPLRLAKLTGAPILPCIFSVSRRKQFNSWDKFVLPLPFGRGKIIWGSPVYIKQSDDFKGMDRIRQEIEDEMNTLLRQADIEMGHNPVDAQ
ncbi:hypothetical protein DES40_1887 [Litorimonas taeanensis]|uniref:DUF374 domain-containing protein n=1 Tax=Litorimonas taeanensis TaxID=568099 RepID=A0A420WDP2_9PROT|nr:lysophospholipid acyltransferase family protein [Litorimonas taeanensis]RKQ69106.1 hypothetical protein DES40_1887 [Litorimonas taeanensis]